MWRRDRRCLRRPRFLGKSLLLIGKRRASLRVYKSPTFVKSMRFPIHLRLHFLDLTVLSLPLQADAVRDAMRHAWTGYVEHAWGADELQVSFVCIAFTASLSTPTPKSSRFIC